MSVLAFDIGGTKVVAGFFAADAAGRLRLLHQHRFESKDYHGLGGVARAYLELNDNVVASAVGIGVAGPVTGRHAKVTNLPWVVAIDEVEEQIGSLQGSVPKVALINDLEAHAYGLSDIAAEHLHMLDPGLLNAKTPLQGNKALIAPGTGLGEAILFRTADGEHQPSASEGGHCDFAAYDDFDDRYLRFLRRKHPQHVSWERVASGGEGFANLHRFLVEEEGKTPIEGLAGQPDKQWGEPIVRAATAGEPLAVCIVERFCTYLAREAANLALKSMSLEGVYFGGGVVGGILPWLRGEVFREAFLAKGRFAGLLARMPLYAVTDPLCGLKGAAVAALKVR